MKKLLILLAILLVSSVAWAADTNVYGGGGSGLSTSGTNTCDTGCSIIPAGNGIIRATEIVGTTGSDIVTFQTSSIITGGQLVSSTSGTVTAQYLMKCTTISAATASSDFMLERFTRDVTIKAVSVTQIGATNVIGHIDECDANGANCAGVDGATDITATTTTALDDGTLSNPSIDANDVIAWHTTSVSGTNTQLMVCIYFIYN